MYHKTAVLNGNNVHVELGVPGGTNPEHIANAHVYIEGIGHIRGFRIYRKQKDGETEMLIQSPGYKKTENSKYDTAYIVLDPALRDLIAETVRETPKDAYSKYYVFDQWSIWSVAKWALGVS